MLNLKSLTSGVAAAALVSAIGLAYAQTTTMPPAASDTPSTTTTPGPMQAAPAATPSSTSSTNPNDALNGTVTEPAPQADRN